jgi:hypothetical protein
MKSYQQIVSGLFAAILFVLLCHGTAAAVIVANGPNDICAPAADPCIVADKVTIVAPGVLDFGLRTLRVVAGGRLDKTADITCGAFEVTNGTGQVAIDSNNGNGDAGTFTVTAFRACSGDGSTPCLDDALCASLTLGTCSVGNGTISIAAKVNGKGGPGAAHTYRAAGDITIDGTINLNGTIAGADGGILTIESFSGSVVLNAQVKAMGAGPQYYGLPEQGGEVHLSAAEDVEVRGTVELAGGQIGGFFYIQADRDATVSQSVNVNAGKLFYAYGGVIELSAGR